MADRPPPRFLKGRFARTPQRVKCISYPNRNAPRLYKPKSAGDIVCLILKQRTQQKVVLTEPDLRRELRRQLDRCLPCEEDEEGRRPLRQAMAAAVAAMQQVVVVIAIAIAVLAALVLVTRAFPFLLRAAPFLVPMAARRAITEVPGLLARLRAARAANDVAWRRLANF